MPEEKEDKATVFVIDDQRIMRRSLCQLIRSTGLAAESFESAEEFLHSYDPSRPGCMLLDLQMPGMTGLQLLERLAAKGGCRPVIIITGHADVPTAVRAMRAGAVDIQQKPFKIPELLERIRQSIALDAEWRRWNAEATHIIERINSVSPREREVLDFVIAGQSTKEIADQLGLSVKTIELHRHSLMQKMGARSPVDLVRMISACRAPKFSPSPL
jgi:two-component system, LuxR family, response regulator FixJ